MKGLLPTGAFLKSVLNKEVGLRTGKPLSHVCVFEIPGVDRLLFFTDVAFIPYPTLEDKKCMIDNNYHLLCYYNTDGTFQNLRSLCCVDDSLRCKSFEIIHCQWNTLSHFVKNRIGNGQVFVPLYAISTCLYLDMAKEIGSFTENRKPLCLFKILGQVALPYRAVTEEYQQAAIL